MKSRLGIRARRTAGNILPLGLLIVAVGAIIALGRVSADGPPSGQSEPAGAKSAVAQSKPAVPAIDLNKPIHYEFKDTKLREVLKKLATDNHIGFWLDTPTLADAEINDSFPITARSVDAEPLQDALDKIFAATPLTWDSYDNVIYVRTGALYCFPSHETHVYKLLRPGKPDKLIDTITTEIRPNTWDRAGGRGLIKPWAERALLISQTPRVHRLIEKNYATLLLRIDPNRTEPILKRANPDAALLAKLDETVDCDFADIPLRDVIKYLSERCKLAFHFDETALNTAGVKLSRPINEQLHGIRVNWILDQIENDFGLTWFVDSDGVQIATRDQKLLQLSLVSYKVRDLPSTPAKPDALVELIKEWVCPSTWDSNGGKATISLGDGGTLEVRQTEDVHRRIEQLLATLRLASR